MSNESFVCSILECIGFERGGVLLTGSEGLGQKKDAESLARKFLGGNPKEHPDFISFDEIEEEDKVLSLKQSLSMLPAKAERRIIYIPNIDQRGVVVQNRLLKLVEEADAFFICTAQGDTLGTVASRLMIVPYNQISLLEHLESGGSIPGWFCSEDESVLPIFNRVYDAILEGSTKDLLYALNLVKEKDKEAFSEVHGCFIPSLFCLIGKALSDRGEDISLVSKAVEKANKIRDRYGIPEFFADITELIPVTKN